MDCESYFNWIVWRIFSFEFIILYVYEYHRMDIKLEMKIITYSGNCNGYRIVILFIFDHKAAVGVLSIVHRCRVLV